MVDIENELYTALHNAMPTGVTMSSLYVRTPSSFPHVQFWETDDSINVRGIDSLRQDNYADKTFELNVYSNKTDTKKAECKSLVAIADSVLMDKGLVRIYCRPTPNIEDMTIYRITARYQCTVDNNKQIYRR